MFHVLRISHVSGFYTVPVLSSRISDLPGHVRQTNKLGLTGGHYNIRNAWNKRHGRRKSNLWGNKGYLEPVCEFSIWFYSTYTTSRTPPPSGTLCAASVQPQRLSERGLLREEDRDRKGTYDYYHH